MCVRPGEAKVAIEEESTCASLLGSPPLGHDTHGGSTTKQGIGEEAKVTVRPRSAQSCGGCQKSFVRHRETCGSVHTDGDQAVNPKVLLGGVPLSCVCA